MMDEVQEVKVADSLIVKGEEGGEQPMDQLP
jgi:hypothetical protein